MNLAELQALIETMKNLPCVMKQLEEVQVRSLTVLCFGGRKSDFKRKYRLPS